MAVPVAFHSVIAILVSLLVFPESVHGQFRRRFNAVFTPLTQALYSQPELLTMESVAERESELFDAALALFQSRIRTAETALGGLRAARRLMRRDVAYGRFGADDFKKMHELARRMTVRAHGMAFYFKIMDPSRHRFPGTRTPGTHTPLQRTPAHSPPGSPPTTPGTHAAHVAPGGILNVGPRSPTSSITSRRRRAVHRIHHAHLSSPLHNLFQHFPLHMRMHGHGYGHHGGGGASLFAPSLDPHGPGLAPEAGPVGVFESQAYLDLEARFAHAGADTLRARAMGLLGAEDGAGPLLRCAADALGMCGHWVERIDEEMIVGRVVRLLKTKLGMRRKRKVSDNVVLQIENVRARLLACLEEFRKEKR